MIFMLYQVINIPFIWSCFDSINMIMLYPMIQSNPPQSPKVQAKGKSESLRELETSPNKRSRPSRDETSAQWPSGPKTHGTRWWCATGGGKMGRS